MHVLEFYWVKMLREFVNDVGGFSNSFGSVFLTNFRGGVGAGFSGEIQKIYGR